MLISVLEHKIVMGLLLWMDLVLVLVRETLMWKPDLSYYIDLLVFGSWDYISGLHLYIPLLLRHLSSRNLRPKLYNNKIFLTMKINI